MAKKKAPDAQPRFIELGSCTWCGHPPHAGECTQQIRVLVGVGTDSGYTTGTCPCRRREAIADV